MEIMTDKNITFSSDMKIRRLTFHSNFKSACMEEKLLHRDEFAQSSFDEYHGVVICNRGANTGGDKEICRMPVTLPKPGVSIVLL